MLKGLKRLFSGTAASPSQEGWEGMGPWAESRQYAYRNVHGDGFVIDGRQGVTPWRLEWGPSQRAYITGQELRIRAELGLGSDLQVVLMNRQLQEAMEKAVFEQYVEGVQTRIDNQTPPEMRWLVMFPKLAGAEMPLLRERFIALASIQKWLLQWLDGPLTASLASVRMDPATPVVLMIGRGRLMLRTALPDAQVGAVQAWLRIFEVAMREALRVSIANANTNASAASPSTQASMWPVSSALPGDERDKP